MGQQIGNLIVELDSISIFTFLVYRHTQNAIENRSKELAVDLLLVASEEEHLVLHLLARELSGLFLIVPFDMENEPEGF